jgi:hypothetical protein
MILRPAGSSHTFITQPDHAALAARIMKHWRREAMPGGSRQAAIMMAIGEHDNGWHELDAAPILDRNSRKVLDFIGISDDLKRSVWPRAVNRLAGTPYAAALVAQHALHIYRRYRERDDWKPFFVEMEQLRERQLRQAPDVTLADLTSDYLFVRLGDLASLAFCNAWSEPQNDEFGYSMRVDGDRLIIEPDPFGGHEVPIEINGREMPDRRYTSDVEAADVYAAAPHVVVRGIAIGG